MDPPAEAAIAPAAVLLGLPPELLCARCSKGFVASNGLGRGTSGALTGELASTGLPPKPRRMAVNVLVAVAPGIAEETGTALAPDPTEALEPTSKPTESTMPRLSFGPPLRLPALLATLPTGCSGLPAHAVRKLPTLLAPVPNGSEKLGELLLPGLFALQELRKRAKTLMVLPSAPGAAPDEEEIAPVAGPAPAPPATPPRLTTAGPAPSSLD